MVKMTSMLEKLNLIEKVDKKNLKDTVVYEDNNELVELLNKDDNIHNSEDKSVNSKIEKTESITQNEIYENKDNIDYDNKMMANEIYSYYGLENSNINTVFMLENLIKALPQDLPQEVIKQSVNNVINASSIDLDKLISDGEQRLGALVKIMENYNTEINNNINDCKNEIEKFTQLIDDARSRIKTKEAILEEQKNIVKYETQKIDSIIGFFEK